MDELLLSMIAKIEWVSDRLTPQDVKARHIGRVVTFFYGADAVAVTGTLERCEGIDLLVSGDIYDYRHISSLKVWRKAIAR